MATSGQKQRRATGICRPKSDDCAVSMRFWLATAEPSASHDLCENPPLVFGELRDDLMKTLISSAKAIV